MYFARFDLYRVTQWRGGAIYKTEPVGSKWFAFPDFPPTNQPDKDGLLWCHTNDDFYGRTLPEELQTGAPK